MQCVRNCDSKDPRRRQHFEQPVIQTIQMFIGEMGCWLVLAARSAYIRYMAHRKRRGSGYKPVGTDDLQTIDSDEDDSSNRRPTTPVVKPLVPNDETKTPLRGWKLVLLLLPSCADITGTTLMNIGLLFVAASIYQMVRGALVLFVGFFSVVFLGRRLHLYQWSALVLVVVGVGIVGVAGALFKDHKAVPSVTEVQASAALLARQVHAAVRTPEAMRTVIGILLIACAQIFTASQMVLEEWILEHYAMEPLKIVAWEGVFGFLVTTVGMIFLHLAVGRTERGRYGYFDAKEGWRQMTHYRPVLVSGVLSMISIGWVFFSFKYMHSTSLSTYILTGFN